LKKISAASDPAQVRVRPAGTGDGEKLREIAIAAKAHWGYPLEQVEAWAAMGDVSPKELREKDIFVAEADGGAIGWASLIRKSEACWLDDLWVEPPWIGAGIGSLLFRHAAERARELGAVRLEWEAEPNAIGFYTKMGGRYLRDSKPTVWGRVVPIMGMDLSQ
jgi:GNAT superfamily N-acetyltransferase